MWITLKLGVEYEAKVWVEGAAELTDQERVKRANDKMFDRMDMEV